jgi:cytochrome P450
MVYPDGVSQGNGNAAPPGPGQPATAQMLQWMFRPIPFMERCRERYGPIFKIELGAAEAVVVADPRGAKQVLAGHPEVFDSGAANRLFRPAVGPNSLLLLDGAEHMAHRRILLPSFRGGHVQQFTEMIESLTMRRLARWPTGKEFELAPEMEALTFEAIWRIVFGTEDDPREERLAELIPDMMDRAESPFALLPKLRFEAGGLSPFARLMRVVDEIDDLLYEAIAERAADPLAQLRDDVLSVLLRSAHEDGTPLSEREIRDEVITLLMAGYETTTSALTWSFERLTRSPEVLNRLLDEIDRGEDTYLDAVVKETLRQRPVVPIVARTIRAPVELHGYTMPTGTVLMACVYLVHNDPESYPEPEEFRPERFLGEAHNPAAWIPFGGGVRRCLGASFAQLEMKVVLRTVLGALKLEAPDTRPEPTIRRRFTFVAKHGGTVVAEPRAPRRPALTPGAARIEAENASKAGRSTQRG